MNLHSSSTFFLSGIQNHLRQYRTSWVLIPSYQTLLYWSTKLPQDKTVVLVEVFYVYLYLSMNLPGCIIFSYFTVDMVSAPFKMDRMQLFEHYDDPTNFFRPSIRSLLVSIVVFISLLKLLTTIMRPYFLVPNS